MSPLDRRSMMPVLAPIGARVAPMPQRRTFRAATAGVGRAHKPLGMSGVTGSREVCDSGAAATAGSLDLPGIAELGKEGWEDSRSHNKAPPASTAVKPTATMRQALGIRMLWGIGRRSPVTQVLSPTIALPLIRPLPPLLETSDCRRESESPLSHGTG